MISTEAVVMKKAIILLIISAMSSGCVQYIPDPNNNNTNSTAITVYLIPDDDPTIFSKSVILLNNDGYLQKTPLNAFISGYLFLLAGYDDLKNKAINDGTQKNSLFLTDYLKSGSDSLSTLAYYLQNGNCYLFDKQSQTSVKTIQYLKYKDESPVETRIGRRFYVENNLFLETVDTLIPF
jgi:hypothetical protein